ncbi:MAG TPA: CDP-alcohol phosphatidyltransferase family protein [Bryobacteraceae bacterium]|nr:CDP-alcohol phosphatidyltransferase family protein [Bryobacteraceae bacterium]
MSTAATVRVQQSLLAPLEKRALIWIAERLPRAVNSDHLTVLGISSMVAAALAYWYSASNPIGLWIVNICLVLNWFGDSLDGTLARVRNRQRPRYGYYVDHVVDVIAISLLMGGMALSGSLSPTIAAFFLVGYLLLSSEVFLATHSLNKFQISFFKFSPTELRILLIIGNLFVYYMDPEVKIGDQTWQLYDIGFAIGAAGVMLIFAITAIRHTIQLYNEERLD